jgi:lipid A 4'-phosphatase
MKKGIGLSLLVFVILLGITWLAVRFDLDIKIGRLFFSEDGGWIYRNVQPWRALYQYGTIPGLILTLAALIVFFAGFVREKWRDYRSPMLVVILTSVLGAGLLVNGILKPYCGRPRPREVTAFNGHWAYCAPCLNSTPGKGMSFPCGHCTMGFLFVTLIYCRRKSSKIAYGGAAIGLVLGALLGVARAAQGAHFATDTLWSLGVILIVSLVLNDIIIPIVDNTHLWSRTFTRRQLAVFGICVCSAAIVITLVFMTRRPYYGIESRLLSLPPKVQHLVVHANQTFANSTLAYSDEQARIEVVGQGFGWPTASEDVDIVAMTDGDALKVTVNIVAEGYFAELRHELLLTLPLAFKDRLKIEILDTD